MVSISVDSFPQHYAIARLSGKKYVVPFWIEVPNDALLSDIEISFKKRRKSGPSIVKEEYITGSKGDEYLVKLYDDGSGTCECWGYRRRKDCKHLKALRAS